MVGKLVPKSFRGVYLHDLLGGGRRILRDRTARIVELAEKANMSEELDRLAPDVARLESLRRLAEIKDEVEALQRLVIAEAVLTERTDPDEPAIRRPLLTENRIRKASRMGSPRLSKLVTEEREKRITTPDEAENAVLDHSGDPAAAAEARQFMQNSLDAFAADDAEAEDVF